MDNQDETDKGVASGMNTGLIAKIAGRRSNRFSSLG